MKGYSPHAQTLADPQTFLIQLELVSHLLQPEKYKQSNNSNACLNVIRSHIRCQSFAGVNLEIHCRPLIKSV